MKAPLVTSEQLERYKRDGFLVMKGLFNHQAIHEALMALDQLLAARDGAPLGDPATLAVSIHARIARLALRDRRELGTVYDAARKVLPFWRLLGSERMGEVVAQLLETPFVGVAFRGAGVRFDLPQEDRWRSEWHQEYHSQISSPRGLVAWFGLSQVDLSMGPVELSVGSHVEGILPVVCLDPLNRNKDYTQTFAIHRVEEIVRRYPVASFETEPGDAVFLDFLLLHRSGFNRSSAGRSRLTCQVRYFDMNEATSIRHGWIGGWQDGGNFATLHPELVQA